MSKEVGSYVIKPLKSTHLQPSLLVVGLSQTHRNEITELISVITFSMY